MICNHRLHDLQNEFCISVANATRSEKIIKKEILYVELAIFRRKICATIMQFLVKLQIMKARLSNHERLAVQIMKT